MISLDRLISPVLGKESDIAVLTIDNLTDKNRIEPLSFVHNFSFYCVVFNFFSFELFFYNIDKNI